MSSWRKTLSEAERLIERGETSKARDLLLKRGFVEQVEPEIAGEFARLIPFPRASVAVLEGPLTDLKSADAGRRREAARWLHRESLREISNTKAEWLADPRTTALLIDSLSDPDPGVVKEASGALAFVLRRYFPDLRAFSPMRALLANSDAQVRFHATVGVGSLRNPERWNCLIAMANDRAALVRKEFCLSVLRASRQDQLSSIDKSVLREPICRLLSDQVSGVRMVASNALLEIGDESLIPVVKERIAKEKAEDVRTNLRRVAKVLKGGIDPNLVDF